MSTILIAKVIKYLRRKPPLGHVDAIGKVLFRSTVENISYLFVQGYLTEVSKRLQLTTPIYGLML